MLNIRPVTFVESKDFISRHHRHHGIPQGWLWGHGVENDDGTLVGVCTVGRPVARLLDDGYTCEVTRLCTDGTYNACSILYSAARKAAEAKGFRRILTYILESENGASLKAAGWSYLGECGGGVRGTEKVEPEPTNTPQAKNTAMDVDLGESWRPRCRVCGSENLAPDHGGYFYDSVTRYGAPLCCLDHEKRMNASHRTRE